MFSGQIETLLIVLIASVTVLYQIDSSIISSTLNVKKKIIVTLFSSFITIGLAFVLVPMYSTMGLLIAILTGIIVLSFSNTYLVMKITSSSKVFFNLYFSRISIAGIAIIVFSNYLSKFVEIETWFSLFTNAFVAGIVLTGLVWFLVANKKQREVIYDSLKKIKN